MDTKRDFIINKLMKPQFIEQETRSVYLEETDNTGKSILELQLSSDKNLSIKNIDKILQM